MIVGIVGAGALGTLLGASLARGATDVRFLVRDERARAAIAANGGIRVENGGTATVTTTASPADLRAIDVLLVAVKTYATEAALAPLRGVLDARVPIVSVQNGIVAADQISRTLEGHPIALGPTTEAATLLAPGYVRHAARGATVLGWASEHAGDAAALASLAHALTYAGVATRRDSPIEPHVWAKLAVNAALNPLTALAGIRNGELLTWPTLRERAGRIAREVAAVAQASGIALPPGDPAEAAWAVAAATASNRSSMLQDLERGRPTEIEALCGAVVTRGRAWHVAVPENARALDEVRARTKA